MPPRGRPQRRKKRRPPAAAPVVEGNGASQAPEPGGPVPIPRVLTVKELGDRMGISPVEVIKELMKNDVMATVNQSIDFETAAIIAHDLGFEPQEEHAAVEDEAAPAAAESTHMVIEEEDQAALKPRQPVVTVLGHVDHGKTSLLDAIRQTEVTAGEAGGITQHIGAYQIEVNDQRITFLDTPGHEAFTAMRARGAQVTDVAVLVVAADDGVMPQTLEAIDHARAAGVPIVVAITKTDLEDAKPDRVKQQLSEREVAIEEYGGDVPCVLVSAKTKDGIQDLLETILIASQILELKANPDRAAIGAIVEAEMDRNRGPIATVLVQTGTLRVGDVVVLEETWGRVKAMFNEHGRRVKSVGPGEPIAILGLQDVARAGDRIRVVRDEKAARQIVVQRLREKEAAALHSQPRVTLDTLFGEISAGKMKSLNIVLKTDVQGSIEPLRDSLEKLTNEQVRVKMIRAASGTVSESDVLLAIASHGIIIGFNTKPEPGALRLIEQEGIDLRLYSVIYNVTEDVAAALEGMLEPVYEDVIQGHAEVREVFVIRRRGNIAGCAVQDGTVHSNDQVRVQRAGEVLADTTVSGLRRFQDDVREVQAGTECGVTVEGFDEFQEGDVLEFYRREIASKVGATSRR
ncbi:MAG: translation initiation factor IF-2 [Dehalococcoidia bacterium]